MQLKAPIHAVPRYEVMGWWIESSLDTFFSISEIKLMPCLCLLVLQIGEKNTIRTHDIYMHHKTCYVWIVPGNERSKASGGTGNVLRQAGFINCSLLVLGRCVDAIRRGLRNIPYRDSKLTRLLSPFLAGKGSLLSLIVCVNPHKDRVDDTLATLKVRVVSF